MDLLDLGTIPILAEGYGVFIEGGKGVIRGGNVTFKSTRSPRNIGFDVRGEWTVTGAGIINPQIGVVLNHMGSSVRDSTIEDAEEDHIRFMSGGVKVLDNRCLGHTDNGSMNHRDCIQGVATNYGVGKDEFNITPIVDVVIEGNICQSDHPEAQGIMMSDGTLVDGSISYNNIEVPSTHGITINRGQSIDIQCNTSSAPINIGSNKPSPDSSANIVLNRNQVDIVNLVKEERAAITFFSENIAYSHEGSTEIILS